MYFSLFLFLLFHASDVSGLQSELLLQLTTYGIQFHSPSHTPELCTDLARYVDDVLSMEWNQATVVCEKYRPNGTLWTVESGVALLRPDGPASYISFYPVQVCPRRTTVKPRYKGIYQRHQFSQFVNLICRRLDGESILRIFSDLHAEDPENGARMQKIANDMLEYLIVDYGGHPEYPYIDLEISYFPIPSHICSYEWSVEVSRDDFSFLPEEPAG